MMLISRKVANSLVTGTKYGFAGLPFGKKRQRVKNDLPKYDVVIAGGNLGTLLSSHLEAALGQKSTIYLAFDKQVFELPAIRQFYENGYFEKFKTLGTTRKLLGKFCAHSEGQGVAQFLPQENAVVLKNGKKVQYEQLVVATGLKKQLNIPGMDEAWDENFHPFFMSIDHPTWRTTMTKTYRFLHNFDGGQAIFYIPPYPFVTEIEAYNFFLAKDIWDQTEKHACFTWANSRFTVINANDSFCHYYERGDSFIKSELDRRKINVEYGLKLVEVKKDTKTAIFKNLQTGETQERPYNHFYSLVQTKPDELLSQSGLADQGGLLDVDPYTLQHKKYPNIFGLGDVNNVPTTKTFWAGFNQLHVVRNNVERQLNGLSLNARYDGTSSADMHVGLGKMVTLAHEYGGKPKDNLDVGFMSKLRYKWASHNKSGIEKLYKFENWGPPYYKLKKTFDGKGEEAKPAVELHPEKKTA